MATNDWSCAKLKLDIIRSINKIAIAWSIALVLLEFAWFVYKADDGTLRLCNVYVLYSFVRYIAFVLLNVLAFLSIVY